MSLPNSMDSSVPAGTSTPLASSIRDVKAFILDVFGMPAATMINAAGFTFNNSGLVVVRLQDAATDPTVTGQLQRNAAQLKFHDGTAARLIYMQGQVIPVADGGTGVSAGTSGGIPYYASTTTMASSALLTNTALVVGGGAAGAPHTLAAATNGQVPIGSTGADPVIATITGGGLCTVTNGAGTITITMPSVTATSAFPFQPGSDAGISTPIFFGPYRASTTEGLVQMPWSYNATAQQLWVTLSVAPGVGNSRTWTFRKNAGMTALSVTISDNATIGSFSTPVSITAGDLINMYATSTGSPAACVPSGTVTFTN